LHLHNVANLGLLQQSGWRVETFALAMANKFANSYSNLFAAFI